MKSGSECAPKDVKITRKLYNGEVFIKVEPEGELHGVLTLKYQNPGNTWEGSPKGFPDGKITVWHPNGKIRQEIEFLSGLPHGHWRIWYEDGHLKEEGQYFLGQRAGKWQEWDAYGQLVNDGTGQYNLAPLEWKDLRTSWYSTLKRIINHPCFSGLLLFTLTYMAVCSTAYYFAEYGTNPKMTGFLSSLYWVISIVPMVGEIQIEPATTAGKIITGITLLCSFFAFAFWVALIGWAFFSVRALNEKTRKRTSK